MGKSVGGEWVAKSAKSSSEKMDKGADKEGKSAKAVGGEKTGKSAKSGGEKGDKADKEGKSAKAVGEKSGKSAKQVKSDSPKDTNKLTKSLKSEKSAKA